MPRITLTKDEFQNFTTQINQKYGLLSTLFVDDPESLMPYQVFMEYDGEDLPLYQWDFAGEDIIIVVYEPAMVLPSLVGERDDFDELDETRVWQVIVDIESKYSTMAKFVKDIEEELIARPDINLRGEVTMVDSWDVEEYGSF